MGLVWLLQYFCLPPHFNENHNQTGFLDTIYDSEIARSQQPKPLTQLVSIFSFRGKSEGIDISGQFKKYVRFQAIQNAFHFLPAHFPAGFSHGLAARRRQVRALWPEAPLWMRAALVYGLIATLLAPTAGTMLDRLVDYGWPAFWLAVPLLAGPLTGMRRHWVVLGMMQVAAAVAVMLLAWAAPTPGSPACPTKPAPRTRRAAGTRRWADGAHRPRRHPSAGARWQRRCR